MISIPMWINEAKIYANRNWLKKYDKLKKAESVPAAQLSMEAMKEGFKRVQEKKNPSQNMKPDLSNVPSNHRQRLRQSIGRGKFNTI